MYRGNHRGSGRGSSRGGRGGSYPRHPQYNHNSGRNHPYRPNNNYQNNYQNGYNQSDYQYNNYSNDHMHYSNHHASSSSPSPPPQHLHQPHHQEMRQSPPAPIHSPQPKSNNYSVSIQSSNATDIASLKPDISSPSSIASSQKQEITNSSFSPQNSNNSSNSMLISKQDVDARKLKQQRLEAWKKKQEVSTVKKSLMTFNKSLRKKIVSKKIRKPLKASSLLSSFQVEEVDSISKKQIKKSTVVTPQKVEEQAEPDLDTIMSELQSVHSNTKKSEPPELELADEEEEEIIDDDEADEDSETARLIKNINERNRKDIPNTSPNTIPFLKSFYQESQFIKDLSNDEVNSLRLRDGIIVRGKYAKRPILTWAQLGLPSTLSSIIEELGFPSPTPIQCETLPNIMNGSDLIGVAKTGSGKTLGFLLPLFRQIISNEAHHGNSNNNSNGGVSEPLSLIMAPTRELALQIFKESKIFLDKLKLRGVCCYGGQPINQQISELKKGCEFIVGTPGRLIDLLCVNGGRCLNFSKVRYTVLDEADRMFDLGFEPQVMKIVKVLRADRQTVLFSATFPPKMEMLAKTILKKPVEIMVGTRNLVNDKIEQKFEVLEETEKFNKLLQILGGFKIKDQEGKIIVFAETQDRCDRVATQLISRGYPSASLHGGKDQIDRDSTINDLKEGVVEVLVATSVASRGLDIKELNLVVNYDAPNHMEDYVHRVGRTARAGNSGESVTFVTPSQEKNANDIGRLLELSNLPIPEKLRQMANSFRSKLKEGDVKYNSGFSGKGLEKLQAIREEHRKIEKQVYDVESGNANPGESPDDDKNKPSSGNQEDTNTSAELSQDLKVTYFTPDDNDPSSDTYHANIITNDLPMAIRWHMTNKENMGKVCEMSSASVTTKGMFYPPGKSPAEGEPPKLYLLIEADQESKVQETVGMFKQLFVEGLNIMKNGDVGKKKYTIS